MAHLRCDFFAESLTLSTSMTVILPERAAGQIGMGGADGDAPPPVLYLLHGLSDDDTIWLRRTSIERYVSSLGLAVVMPQVHRSFYTDEVYGEKFWTFVSEELPAVVQSFFRVSSAPQDTYVAGLSMGGYGAFKLALRHPDRFAAAASLSGALAFNAAERVRRHRPVGHDDPDLRRPSGRRDRRRPVPPARDRRPGNASATVPDLRHRRFPGRGESPLRRRLRGPRRRPARRRSPPASTSGATGTPTSSRCWPGCGTCAATG